MAWKLGAFGLIDPDEPFYALTAREMLARGEWLTPTLFGAPQFEKPPLFYWCVEAAFRLFGPVEAAARFPSALSGFLAVLVTYAWGKILFRRSEPAFLGAAMLATAGLFVALSRVTLTDSMLCLAVTGAWASFAAAERSGSRIAWALFFLSSALGSLVKGPIAPILSGAGVAAYSAFISKRPPWRVPWGMGLAVFAAVALPWYAAMTVRHGWGYLEHFLIHENVRRIFVSEHSSSDRPTFYPLVLFAGFFPWSAFVPPAVVHAIRFARRRPALGVLVAACISTFIILSCTKSKLASYALPIFPPAALLLGAWIWRAERAFRQGARPTLYWKASLAFVWGAAPLAILAGAHSYARRKGFSLDREVVLAAAGLLPLLWAALALAWRRRVLAAAACACAASAWLMAVVFGAVLPAASPAISSRGVSALYVRDAGERGELIVASKMMFRGVAYYANPERVAVFIEDPRRAFYTRPALRLLSTGEDLAAASGGRPVYAFVRAREFGYLKSTVEGHFSIRVIDSNGERFLVHLAPLP